MTTFMLQYQQIVNPSLNSKNNKLDSKK